MFRFELVVIGYDVVDFELVLIFYVNLSVILVDWMLFVCYDFFFECLFLSVVVCSE